MSDASRDSAHAAQAESPRAAHAGFGARRPKHGDVGLQPYFVSTRTVRSEKIFLGEVAEIAARVLREQREKYGFLLLAYVFMPDHAHFVVVPARDHSISQTMRVIKGSIARAVNECRGTEGAVWQTGFFDKNPRNVEELNEFIRYTHDNPVVAGLWSAADGYPYCSADGSCLADYRRFFEIEQT
jgi:REP element-mobilizing transposase RayT